MPGWCRLIETGGGHVRFEASAVQASGKPTLLYDFVLEAGTDDVVRVRERQQAHLPAHCPTRHVDKGGWCCVGLKAGEKIVNQGDAARWWRKLEVFLLCQETAINRGVWPPGMELSHGRAGEVQVAAENIALQRGLLNDYKLALRNAGPVYWGLKLLRRRDAGKLPLVNGRSECICNSRDRRGRRNLRRACWAARDVCLVRLEAQRRALEMQFVEDIKQNGFVCCGTMKDCPFAED